MEADNSSQQILIIHLLASFRNELKNRAEQERLLAVTGCTDVGVDLCSNVSLMIDNLLTQVRKTKYLFASLHNNLLFVVTLMNAC